MNNVNYYQLLFRYVIDIIPLIILILVDHHFKYPKMIMTKVKKTGNQGIVRIKCELLYFLVAVVSSALITGLTIFTSNLYLGLIWIVSAFFIWKGIAFIIRETDIISTNYKIQEYIYNKKLHLTSLMIVLIGITEFWNELIRF